MKIKHLPFSILPVKVLEKNAKIFLGLGYRFKRLFPYLELNLRQARINFKPEEYIALTLFSSILSFVFLGFLLFVFLFILKDTTSLDIPVVAASLIITSVLTLFVWLQQINYPRLIKNRRIRMLEKNLLYSLRNILVQVSAGVPLFNVFASVANGDYGEISNEFKLAVKEISAGTSQADALKKLTANNPSVYFRRAMWQLANGMKAGSDVGKVLEEIIDTISEEQLVQIKSYGSQLNPIAMFYMLLTVIVPSLSITFLIILSAFLGFSESLTKSLFISLYFIVVFMQIMFLGLIKAKRPSLMGE